MGHGGPQTLPKFVVSSFGWSPAVLTEGIITDWTSYLWRKTVIWIAVIPWNNVANNHKRSPKYRGAVGKGAIGFLRAVRQGSSLNPVMSQINLVTSHTIFRQDSF